MTPSPPPGITAFKPLPYMMSYAQNLEDVLLRRALQDVAAGFYVDLGAYHPDSDSITKWFYDNGWSGVNVEPGPALHAEFLNRRPRDINLQCAVGGSNRKAHFKLEEGTGLSHLEDAAGAGGDLIVDVVPLDTILTDHTAGRTIDFLKIDVEGAEAEILNATNLPNRPRIILVEATAPNSQIGVWDSWEPHLLSLGYDFVWFDGLNRFYVDRAEAWRKKFFDVPPNVFDNFESMSFGFANTNTINGRSARQLAELLVDAQEQVDVARGQVGRMEQSTSWRVTRPLRWLAAKLGVRR